MLVKPGFNRHRAMSVCGVILFLSMLNPFVTQAQKNRPVMKDVSTLMNILTRDYYVIDDPEIRLTTIQNDRANVVSTLKAYADNNFLPPGGDWQIDIDAAQYEIKKLKQELAGITTQRSVTKFENNTDLPDALATVASKMVSVQTRREAFMYNRDISTLQSLQTHFANNRNTFLESIVKSFLDKFDRLNAGGTDVYASGSGSVQTQKALNLFGGGALTFTDAIDGLAMFMAKRIKEELAAQVFDKVKTLLNDPTNQEFTEFKILLPRTTSLLQTVQPEQYQGIVTTLKETIEKDLNDLLSNLPHLDQSPRIQLLRKNNPEVDFAFLGIQLINDLNKVKSPTEIIFVLENSAIINKWSTQNQHMNFVNGVKLAALLTYSITEDVSDVRRFISVEEWDSFYKNVDFYKLFTGLIFQQNRKYYNITFNSTALNDKLPAIGNNLNNWYEFLSPKIKELLRQATDIDAQVKGLKDISNAGKKLPVDSVAQLLRSSVVFLDSAISISGQSLKRLQFDVDLRVKSTIYFSTAQRMIDLYADLGMKRYYNAISDAAAMYSSFSHQTDLLKKIQYVYLIGELRQFQDAMNKLAREIAAPPITQATIDEVRAAIEDFRNSCPGCVNMTAFYAGTAGAIPGNIGTLAANIYNDYSANRFTPYVLQWMNRILTDKLTREGLGQWAVIIPSPLPTTYADMIRYLDVFNEAIRQQLPNDPEVVKVVNFLTALAKSETAEDFSKAIEAIVLPAGSAIIKRESAFNISLNGYAGFFGGVERLYKENSNAGNAAFTVPIGVAFSKSARKACPPETIHCKRPGSWTLFLSAIDIGAFTSVRFKDNAQSLPEIKFKNILAPGIQVIYGIPKSSFSIAGGVQYGPMLRKINSSDASTSTNTTTTTTTTTNDDGSVTTTVDANVTTPVSDQNVEHKAFRYGISILIDIPLLNFYTKSKAMKR